MLRLYKSSKYLSEKYQVVTVSVKRLCYIKIQQMVYERRTILSSPSWISPSSISMGGERGCLGGCHPKIRQKL